MSIVDVFLHVNNHRLVVTPPLVLSDLLISLSLKTSKENILHASNKSRQSQITKQPNCELCSFFFSVLCWAYWSTLVYNTNCTMLKTEVISIISPVTQHFIANHTLTSKVQLLLTKPRLSTLALTCLTLIRPQNSKESLNLDTTLLK